MNKRHGEWRLHFRKRMKHPGVFNLIINSRLIATDGNRTNNQSTDESHGVETSQVGIVDSFADLENMIEPQDEKTVDGKIVEKVEDLVKDSGIFVDTRDFREVGSTRGSDDDSSVLLGNPIRLHLKINVVE